MLSGTKKQNRVTDASPNWLQTLQRSIPEVVWEKNQYLAREDTGHITNHVCPQYFKFKREDVTGQERGQNTNVHLQPWDDKQFELKCPNWKLWAYTDGSCIGKAENFISAGLYCPQTKAGCYVDSGGVGMTNTINVSGHLCSCSKGLSLFISLNKHLTQSRAD